MSFVWKDKKHTWNAVNIPVSSLFSFQVHTCNFLTWGSVEVCISYFLLKSETSLFVCVLRRTHCGCKVAVLGPQGVLSQAWLVIRGPADHPEDITHAHTHTHKRSWLRPWQHWCADTRHLQEDVDSEDHNGCEKQCSVPLGSRLDSKASPILIDGFDSLWSGYF